MNTDNVNLHRAYLVNAIQYADVTKVGSIQDFNKGDIISVMAGNPYKEFAIIQLTTDTPDINNLNNHITNGSSGQLTTSQIISSQWSLMKIAKPEIIHLFD